MQSFKQQVLPLVKTFWRGYKSFQLSGTTPVESYHAMRQLYVRTNGWFNDLFQIYFGAQHPVPRTASFEASILKGFSNGDCKQAVSGLKRDGFYVFPQRVDDKYLDPLMKYSFEAPAILQGGDTRTQSNVRFDPDNLIATNYRFGEAGVINVPTIQQFMADPALVTVAQRYIGSAVLFDNVQMWWTTPNGCDAPSSRLAQLFHFDMDRIRFVKFFLYLTDVDAQSGPHCYIRGSAKRKPAQFLEDRRFEDHELASVYPASDFEEITAPRGTLIAVDTRGFHKAKMPTRGNRLILQLQLANCLFGENYEHAELTVQTSQLERAIQRDPYLYSNYRISYATEPSRQLALV